MGTYWYLWVLMGTYWHLWVLKGTYGYLWVLMGTYGYLSFFARYVFQKSASLADFDLA